MKKLKLLPALFLVLMVLAGCGSQDTTTASPEPTVEVTATPEPTVEPTETPEPSEEPALLGWQQAYIDYIESNSNDTNGENSYSLIYLDDDDIPEMLDIGAYEAAGTRVVIYDGSSYSATQMNRLSVAYIPKENILLNNEGNMGYYTASFYSIVDGQLVLKAQGTMVEDSDNMVFDEDGALVEIHYICTWNGESISEDGYYAKVGAIFDHSKALYNDDDDIECYSAEDMVKLLGGEEYAYKYQYIRDIAEIIETAETQGSVLENDIYNGDITQSDMDQHSQELYTLWDNALNDIWNILNKNLSSDTMTQLTQDEKEWITWKEQLVGETRLEYEGGSVETMMENLKAAELTRDRAYELLGRFSVNG